MPLLPILSLDPLRDAVTRVSGHIYTPNIPADSSGVVWEVVLGKIDCASVAVSLLVGGGNIYVA